MRALLTSLSVCSLLIVIDSDMRRMLIALLRKAIRKADLTELQHCQQVGMKQSHWSAQCAAQEPLNGEALIRTDLETWRWFALLILQAYGLPREVRLSAPIIKKMARMDLEEPDDERNVS